PESQQNFVVGGKRRIIVKNALGNCQCLQTVIYKPSFGGQFVFEASDGSNKQTNQNILQYSPDGKEASFEIDATNFQAGSGEIELRTYGGEATKIPLKLYPMPPNITGFKIGKGDREGIISGERLEQLQSLKINGRRAFIVGSQSQGNQLNYPKQSNFNQPGNQTVNQVNNNQPSLQPTPNSVNIYSSNLQAANQNERVIVFEDTNAKITESTANMELELEDNRMTSIKQTFPVSPSRPRIITDEYKEIEGTAISSQKSTEFQVPKTKDHLDLSKLSVFPVNTPEIILNVQNALTDYDFKVENLSLETRMEKSSVNNSSGFNSFNPSNNYGIELTLPKAQFEVLDWKNLRITFYLSEQVQRLFGGRRLQFRIKDKERGDSDWYSIKQTFVRIPQISSVICTTEMNGMCEMKGATTDYISQVSVDGGQTWYPNSPTTLQVQPTQDGQKKAMIPLLPSKKLLMVKLRDYPKGEGIHINNFDYSNRVKNAKAVAQPNSQTINQVNKNAPSKQSDQIPIPMLKVEKSPLENKEKRRKRKRN
ncbi:MAG: hypothetical protein AAB336_02910, partial [Acidobacteriota bacterium]